MGLESRCSKVRSGDPCPWRRCKPVLRGRARWYLRLFTAPSYTGPTTEPPTPIDSATKTKVSVGVLNAIHPSGLPPRSWAEELVSHDKFSLKSSGTNLLPPSQPHSDHPSHHALNPEKNLVSLALHQTVDSHHQTPECAKRLFEESGEQIPGLLQPERSLGG
jgi:hypothetical protein